MNGETVRFLFHLTIRRRNGRPRILPPEDVAAWQARRQDPHILKALGRAWAWRGKLDSGEMATVGEIAKAERMIDPYVSRTMRLAYLSPEALERLVVGREPPVVSWNDLIRASYLRWAEQPERVLDLTHLVAERRANLSAKAVPLQFFTLVQKLGSFPCDKTSPSQSRSSR